MSLRALWDWLKEYFNTRDRQIASASLVLSFIGVVLSIVTVQLPGTSGLIAVRDFAIAIGLVLLIIYFVGRNIHLGMLNRQQLKLIEQSKSILSNQFKNSYELIHNCKQNFFAQYYSPGTRHRLTEAEHKFLRHVCRQITYMTRKSLQEYFLVSGIDIEEDVAITVKLIFETDEVIEKLKYLRDWDKQMIRSKDQWVLTVYRDPHTYQEHPKREVLRIAYDIDTNTAFDEIFTHRAPHYLCNDLQSLGDDKYHNLNHNWKEQYNATLVVPIGYDDGANLDRYVCYGFLAADSLNKQRDTHPDIYNDKECYSILGHAADLLAIFLLSLAIDVDNPSTNTKPSDIPRTAI